VEADYQRALRVNEEAADAMVGHQEEIKRLRGLVERHESNSGSFNVELRQLREALAGRDD
jgi:hypothetical protein